MITGQGFFSDQGPESRAPVLAFTLPLKSGTGRIRWTKAKGDRDGCYYWAAFLAGLAIHAVPSAGVATIEIDLLGAMYGVRFALPAMRKRGGGAIVNVSSTSALTHGPGHSRMTPYGVAKIGVLRMTTTLSALRDSDNIRVNCLVPHWVAVPEVKAYWDTLTPEERGSCW